MASALVLTTSGGNVYNQQRQRVEKSSLQMRYRRYRVTAAAAAAAATDDVAVAAHSSASNFTTRACISSNYSVPVGRAFSGHMTLFTVTTTTRRLFCRSAAAAE